MDVDFRDIEKYTLILVKTLFAILVMLIMFSFIELEANKLPPEEIAKKLEEAKELRRAVARENAGIKSNENFPDVWPPKMNTTYPEIELFDQTGREFLLSSLQKRVLVVEYIDISSPVSQAQSGAYLAGPYYAAATTEIDEYAEPFADVLRKNSETNVILPDDNIIELKIIVYGEGGGPGTRDDAQNWAKHFNLNISDNVIVAVPKKDFRGKETQEIIGGYHLVDKNLRLRVDSAGPMPKHNLKMTLAPLAAKLMKH